MPRFDYEAYDANGGRVKGSLEADDLAAARRLLTQSRLTPVRMQEVKADSGSGRAGVPRRLSLKELELLTSQLGVLLGNGVRIHRALETLAKGSPSPGARSLLQAVLEAVRRGESLARALGNHPLVFDRLFVNLVALGEASGRLPEVLQGVAADLRYRQAIAAKVTQALVYPAFIVFVCVIALGFIFNVVVPRLSTLFTGVAELPVYTEILLAVSNFMQEYQWFVLGGLAAAGVMGRALWQQPAFARTMDDLFARLPGIGGMVRLVERARYSSALALTLESGLPIDEAMSLAAEGVKNRPLRAALLAAREQVKRGNGLTRSLAQTPLFPDFYVSLIEVGEESGGLAVIFREIAQRSREAFEAWVVRFTSLLEPALIVIMGLIVGTVVGVMLLSVVAVQDVGL